MYKTKWTRLFTEVVTEEGHRVGQFNSPNNESSVIVITESGDERELWYSNGLWFLPDRSMYVYFVPVFWRYKD